MDHTTLADIFYIMMSLAALVIIVVFGALAYYGYRIFRKAEEAGTRVVAGLVSLEESIKKLPFFHRAIKTRRKTKATSTKE